MAEETTEQSVTSILEKTLIALGKQAANTVREFRCNGSSWECLY